MFIEQEDAYSKKLLEHIIIAAEQKSVGDFYFMPDEFSFFHHSARCVKLLDNCLVARIQKTEQDAFPVKKGMDAACYISVNRECRKYFHFTSRVSKLVMDEKNQLVYIFLPVPKFMDLGRHRNSLRVELSEETAKPFTVWHGLITIADEIILPKLDWRKLPRTTARLADISANGFRVDIDEDIEFHKLINTNDVMLVKFQPEKRKTYALASVCRKAGKKGIIGLGCRFYAWRNSGVAGSQSWLRVVPKAGVAPIAEWIARNFRTVDVK